MKPAEGRKRVIIEDIQPQIDGGRYPVRRILGDRVDLSAAIFSDGHDHVAAQLLYRHESEPHWHTTSMMALPNDFWSASFTVNKLGTWIYTIQAWVDHFDTWTADLKKRLDAQPDPSDPAKKDLPPQDIPLAFRSGALLLDEAAKRATAASAGIDAEELSKTATALREMAGEKLAVYAFPLTPDIEELAAKYPDLRFATTYATQLKLWADRERARFSSWYELFPRSTSPDPNRHGTLADVASLVPAIAAMGFDILYLPPIHPIGHAFRKGPNNNVVAQPEDEGSPWAIGSPEGGHTAIHPKLGTFADFGRLVSAARDVGMELAMDIAFQCSPDHPWVRLHPDWFNIRPDGSIQYAENPPKKYQDIYPLNFESPDWQGLWDALREVFQFWIDRGVRVFRVDNPHTKALPFWEWCIGDLHQKSPDVLFLAEAFTRPHIMYSLAKGGFSQSYTYFTWRTEKRELQAYFEEITKPPVSDFFTPNVWPNTPDILHELLQTGGRPAFMQRLILATTLAASYGIYGPAYELGENLPAKPAAGKTGSEEYLDSEKYQIRRWDRSASHSLAALVTRLNQIRHANPALQSDLSLHFHPVDNPQIICYSKSAPATDGAPANVILVAVNLDPHNEQAGWIDIDLKLLGIGHDEAFTVEDLLTGVSYRWHDRSNYVALRPDVLPAHVFRVVRSQT
jgi:starch synthase (maltosyl-transferring)